MNGRADLDARFSEQAQKAAFKKILPILGSNFDGSPTRIYSVSELDSLLARVGVSRLTDECFPLRAYLLRVSEGKCAEWLVDELCERDLDEVSFPDPAETLAESLAKSSLSETAEAKLARLFAGTKDAPAYVPNVFRKRFGSGFVLKNFTAATENALVDCALEADGVSEEVRAGRGCALLVDVLSAALEACKRRYGSPAEVKWKIPLSVGVAERIRNAVFSFAGAFPSPRSASLVSLCVENLPGTVSASGAAEILGRIFTATSNVEFLLALAKEASAAFKKRSVQNRSSFREAMDFSSVFLGLRLAAGSCDGEAEEVLSSCFENVFLCCWSSTRGKKVDGTTAETLEAKRRTEGGDVAWSPPDMDECRGICRLLVHVRPGFFKSFASKVCFANEKLAVRTAIFFPRMLFGSAVREGSPDVALALDVLKSPFLKELLAERKKLGVDEEFEFETAEAERIVAARTAVALEAESESEFMPW